MGKFIDLTGRTFGRYTILDRAESINKVTMWNALCSCGNYRTVTSNSLIGGKSKSCGCLHREMLVKQLTTHGQWGHPIYCAWSNIVQRCTNSKNVNYKNYGGRGIKVCKSWLSFINFYKWSIANGWTAGLTIDRINNNKGYRPSNCRWTTMKVQCRNHRRNILVPYNGKKISITEFAEIKGLKSKTLISRISDYGWSIQKAISTPIKRKPQIV